MHDCGAALPEASSIRIKGSGDVTLDDLQQAELDPGAQGSDDITAFGQVDLLDAEVAGSGDVDASELVAKSAKLSMVGSADIDAYVSDSVSARVMGSSDIVIRGNPPIRDHSVAGSGDIKFKRRSTAPAGSDGYVTERRQSIHFVPTIDQE